MSESIDRLRKESAAMTNSLSKFDSATVLKPVPSIDSRPVLSSTWAWGNTYRHVCYFCCWIRLSLALDVELHSPRAVRLLSNTRTVSFATFAFARQVVGGGGGGGAPDGACHGCRYVEASPRYHSECSEDWRYSIDTNKAVPSSRSGDQR